MPRGEIRSVATGPGSFTRAGIPDTGNGKRSWEWGDEAMTAQQVRLRVFRHLVWLLFTLSLVAVLALLMWRLRPEDFAMWFASLLVGAHVPGMTLDAWQCIHFLTFKAGDDPLPQRPFPAGAPTPTSQRRRPLTAKKATLSVSGLLILTVLVIGGCSEHDDPPTAPQTTTRVTPRGFDVHHFASILDRMTVDDLVVVGRSEREHPEDEEGSVIPLGVEYWARVWRPEFVEAWVFAASVDPPVPVCEGAGYAFMRCVKRYLDDGEDMTIHREGDVHHAHLRPE